MDKWLLDKADANCPKLFEREICTDKTVKIIADDSFFGASAVAEGVIPPVLRTGDCFTLDFGSIAWAFCLSVCAMCGSIWMHRCG